MSYPNSIDSFQTYVDDVDNIVAATVNDLHTSTLAIENALGTNPHGTAADLKTRLAVSINNDGTLKKFRTAISDVNYTILSTDVYIGLTSITTPRVFTLPAASSVQSGYELYVFDESGSVSTTNTLTIQRAGSDTIDGGTSVVVAAPYCGRRFFSNGTNKWVFDGGVLRSSSNLSDVQSVPISRANLRIDKRTAVTDQNYTVLVTDVYVAYIAISTARVVTLPAANSVNAGYEIEIADESGNVSSTNTLTIQRAGSDTIGGGTSVVIAVPYGMMRFFSDGTSKWIYDSGVLRTSNNLSDVQNATTSRINLGVKSGVVAGTSFAGNPKKITITFANAFANTNYAINISAGIRRTWSYESKAAGSFVINANANMSFTEEVSWICVQTGG